MILLISRCLATSFLTKSPLPRLSFIDSCRKLFFYSL